MFILVLSVGIGIKPKWTMPQKAIDSISYHNNQTSFSPEQEEAISETNNSTMLIFMEAAIAGVGDAFNSSSINKPLHSSLYELNLVSEKVAGRYLVQLNI
jgi:hypothetical protein